MTARHMAAAGSRAVAASCVAALAVVACGGSDETSDPPADPSTYEEGRDLYVEFCSSCHGSDGGGGVGKALSQGRAGDLGHIADTIRDGGDQMPGLGSRLTDEQIDAIARYVHDRL